MLRAEKFFQAAGREIERHYVLLSCALIAPEERVIAAIALCATSHQDVGKLARIAQAQIDALASQRMHIVGGIAEERCARLNEPGDALPPQRKCRDLGNQL
jgi:hypothetical protein